MRKKRAKKKKSGDLDELGVDFGLAVFEMAKRAEKLRTAAQVAALEAFDAGDDTASMAAALVVGNLQKLHEAQMASLSALTDMIDTRKIRLAASEAEPADV